MSQENKGCITFLGFFFFLILGSFAVNKINWIAIVLYIVAIGFFIVNIRNAGDSYKRKQQAQQAEFDIKMLTSELNELEIMYKNSLITEEEYSNKKKALNNKYSSSIETYVNK